MCFIWIKSSMPLAPSRALLISEESNAKNPTPQAAEKPAGSNCCYYKCEGAMSQQQC
jgi:hypothetical protein